MQEEETYNIEPSFSSFNFFQVTVSNIGNNIWKILSEMQKPQTRHIVFFLMNLQSSLFFFFMLSL